MFRLILAGFLTMVVMVGVVGNVVQVYHKRKIRRERRYARIN